MSEIIRSWSKVNSFPRKFIRKSWHVHPIDMQHYAFQRAGMEEFHCIHLRGLNYCMHFRELEEFHCIHLRGLE